MKQPSFPFSLTGTQLKYIALFTMTLDHIGVILFTPGHFDYQILRAIGRIAFPIFAFVLVEGFLHTSNYKKYFIRMFLFALLSEIPFDLALYRINLWSDYKVLFSHQNIFFTLSAGFLSMYLIERFYVSCPLLSVLGVAVALFLAQTFHFDYGGFGILVILLFYGYQRFYHWLPSLFGYAFALLPLLISGGSTRFFVLFSLLPLLFYSGQKGEFSFANRQLPGGKYFFYVYYPAHLLCLAFLRFLIHLLLS
jgi:hypothetical protein